VKRAVVLLGLAAAAGVVPAQAAAPLARVQVVAVEFQYRLSRANVKAGLVRFELVNFGEDEHNLRIRKVGETKAYLIPGTLSGERHVITLRLKPGLYKLTCTMADHAMRGMKAQLRVRPRT
jgi:plastocyanin